jgi:hypothetical protein
MLAVVASSTKLDASCDVWRWILECFWFLPAVPSSGGVVSLVGGAVAFVLEP